MLYKIRENNDIIYSYSGIDYIKKEEVMNKYISAAEAAMKWDISKRRVLALCAENRIKGAMKQCGVWFIPSDAKKPQNRLPGRKKEPTKRPLNVLSLFSGCGGMDLGFEGDFKVLSRSVNMSIHPDWCSSLDGNRWNSLPKTRFNTVFANDIKPEAKSAWINYFTGKGIDGATYCLNSIVDLVKLEKDNNIQVFPNNIDVVTGGFPCQDFSVAGKRLGFESDKGHTGSKIDVEQPTIENRGQLYMWMREVINITRPKLFIAENVKGLTNLNDAKEIIEKDFASVGNGGYLVVPARVLNAAEYGVPQGRERVFFIGFNKAMLNKTALKALSSEKILEEFDPYPQKTHFLKEESQIDNKIKFVSVREALEDLPEPDIATDINQKKYSKAKFMGKHCQGQQEVKLDGVGPTIRSEHHGNIEFRRLSKDHGGINLDELSMGLQERRLTIRECARIQTFPDDYSFVIPAHGDNKSVSASEAYKIIGNAVPPLLAYSIAKNLETKWDNYFGVENEAK